MPSDRQRRRAVLLATGIVCSTISTGCLTSSFVRRAADPPSEPSSTVSEPPVEQRPVQNGASRARTDSSVRSASVQQADSTSAGATPATPFLADPLTSSPAPAGVFPLELQAVPSESTGKVVPKGGGAPADPPATKQPAPTSTPLLDAAIERVADVTRQHREAIAASPTPDDAAEKPKRPRLPSRMPAKQSPIPKTEALDQLSRAGEVAPLPKRLTESDPDDRAPAKQPAATPSPPSLSSGPPAQSATQSTTTAPKPAAEAPIATLLNEHQATKASEGAMSEHQPSDERHSAAAAQRPYAVHDGPLSITEFRLCRKVFGFGSFEPLADQGVKAGQRLLVYCELTGLQYEARAAGFVSRISSRVEIQSDHGGHVLWEKALGDAEDVCRRRRRDYYVNYRFELPRSLSPGSYRLRLLQTDLVAGSATSTEIPLEIKP